MLPSLLSHEYWEGWEADLRGGFFACRFCYHACMNKHAQSAIHYTIRGIPAEVDRALRARASQRKQSLNQVVLDELYEALIHA